MKRSITIAGASSLIAISAVMLCTGSAAAYTDLDACPTLAQGYNGGCVSELQTELNQEGAGLTADGSYGPLTKQAVMNFQRNHGLTADGIVGPQTKQALNNANSVATPRPQPAPAPSPAPAATPEEHIIFDCLASTASVCGPEHHEGGEIEAGTIREGFNLWRDGAENGGQRFEMPGRLTGRLPLIP